MFFGRVFLEAPPVEQKLGAGVPLQRSDVTCTCVSPKQSMEVPQTPLHTSRVLKEEKDTWEEVKVSGRVHDT